MTSQPVILARDAIQRLMAKGLTIQQASMLLADCITHRRIKASFDENMGFLIQYLLRPILNNLVVLIPNESGSFSVRIDDFTVNGNWKDGVFRLVWENGLLFGSLTGLRFNTEQFESIIDNLPDFAGSIGRLGQPLPANMSQTENIRAQCSRWLQSLWLDPDHERLRKSDYWTKARTKFSDISKRAFDRAWSDTAQEFDMHLPGRKPKQSISK